MKEPGDKKTLDLLEGIVKRPVGRPETGEAMTNAERQKAYRERQKREGLVPLTVFIPQEMMDALDKFVQFKDIKKDDVVIKALKRDIMRKR